MTGSVREITIFLYWDEIYRDGSLDTLLSQHIQTSPRGGRLAQLLKKCVRPIAFPNLGLTQVYMIGGFAWYGHLVSHLLNAEYSPIPNDRFSGKNFIARGTAYMCQASSG